MSKVLVTGTLGFIGKNLYKKLTESYSDVIRVEEDLFYTEGWQDKLQEQLKLANPDVVFHVGACSNTLESDTNYMMVRNYESTKILVDWCLAYNKPIVYSSSAASYGEEGQHPSNLYGWSKYVAEGYVISNGGIALRYFNVYGPGEEHKGKMASIAYQMFTKHKSKQPIKLFPGKPTRDFVYVDDVVDANLHALENYEDLKGRFFDVGSGTSNSFELVMEYLEIPYGYVTESEIPTSYQYYTCADNERMMKGWRPRYDLKAGIEKYKNYLDKA